MLFNQRWPKLEIWPSALLRNVQNIRIFMGEKAIVFSLMQILIFWTLLISADSYISSFGHRWFNQTASKWQSYFWSGFRILLVVLSFIQRYYFWPSDSYKFILSPTLEEDSYTSHGGHRKLVSRSLGVGWNYSFKFLDQNKLTSFILCITLVDNALSLVRRTMFCRQMSVRRGKWGWGGSCVLNLVNFKGIIFRLLHSSVPYFGSAY